MYYSRSQTWLIIFFFILKRRNKNTNDYRGSAGCGRSLHDAFNNIIQPDEKARLGLTDF